MLHETSRLNRRHLIAAGAAGAAVAGSFGFNRLAAADASEDMITQLAMFKINMDKEEEALELLAGLAKAVEENEPDVLAYMAHRDKDNPEELIFFEIYKDAAALTAHGQTPHLGKLRAKFVTHFKPPLKIVQLDRIGGYHR